MTQACYIARHWPSRALQAPPGQCPVPEVMHHWKDTYLEHTLQLLCYKLTVKVRHQGTRSTWGPGPSKS